MTISDEMNDAIQFAISKIQARDKAFCSCMNDCIEEALKNLQKYLWHYGSHERCYIFIYFFENKYFDNNKPDIFWRALHESWSLFDAIPHDEFRELFAIKRKDWKSSLLMPDDLIFYNSLPETFEAYRGTDANAQHKDGLSWTIDREVAEAFAHGHRVLLNKNPIILTATINKRDIVGAYNGRNEHEIVLFDPPTPHHVEQRPPGKLD